MFRRCPQREGEEACAEERSVAAREAGVIRRPFVGEPRAVDRAMDRHPGFIGEDPSENPFGGRRFDPAMRHGVEGRDRERAAGRRRIMVNADVCAKHKERSTKCKYESWPESNGGRLSDS